MIKEIYKSEFNKPNHGLIDKINEIIRTLNLIEN